MYPYPPFSYFLGPTSLQAFQSPFLRAKANDMLNLFEKASFGTKLNTNGARNAKADKLSDSVEERMLSAGYLPSGFRV